MIGAHGESSVSGGRCQSIGQSKGPLQSGGRVVWNTVLTRPPQQSVTFQAPAVSTLTTQLFVQRYLTPLKVVSLSAFASPVASVRPAARKTLPRERLSILRLRCDRPIGRELDIPHFGSAGLSGDCLSLLGVCPCLTHLRRHLALFTLRISREGTRGAVWDQPGANPPVH